MGTRTDAALAEVLAARADLAEEIDRLEAAGRAAVDIPAKIRRSPAKAAAIAGGGAFLVLGGPKRVFRNARKAITGHEEAPLPKSLLPKDIEKALKKIGTRRRQGPRHDRARLREVPRRAGEGAPEGRHPGGRRSALLAAGAPAGRRRGPASRSPSGCSTPTAAAFEEQLQKIRDAPTRPRRRDADRPTSGRGRGAGRRRAASGLLTLGRASRARLAAGEWRNGRRAGLRSRCRVSGVSVRPRPRLPTLIRAARPGPPSRCARRAAARSRRSTAGTSRTRRGRRARSAGSRRPGGRPDPSLRSASRVRPAWRSFMTRTKGAAPVKRRARRLHAASRAMLPRR